MSEPRATTAEVLASLEAAELLTPDGRTAIDAALAAHRPGDDPPLHLKILAAIGTFFATAFFLAFLGVANLIDFKSGAAMMIWGGLFLVLGLAMLAANRGSKPGIGPDMVAQTALTALAIGKFLAVAGALQAFGFGTHWVATVALLVVTSVTYPVSGSTLDRFLSPYAVAASVLFEVLERNGGGPDVDAALAACFAAFTAIAGGLLLPARIPGAMRPIGTAALAAMFTVVCVVASGHDFGFWTNGRAIDVRPIEAILVAALIGVVAWAAGGVGRLASEALAPVVIGAVVLGFGGAPGIVFALGLLIFGHARHDRPLRVVGVLALPAFLVLWYWARDLDFLAKSAALVGSGAALLLARGWMRLRGLDRETTA